MARKPHEKERDLQITTEFYLKGYSTRAIAKKICEMVGRVNEEARKAGEVLALEERKEYSISHKTVSQDIKFLLKQWYDERIHDITNQKLIELTKIDRLEQTYWDAWEKSIINHRKTITRNKGKTTSKTPDFSEVTDMEIREFGEPRYLQGIERCIDKRCKLLGLDAPIKMDQQDNSFLSFLMHTT